MICQACRDEYCGYCAVCDCPCRGLARYLPPCGDPDHDPNECPACFTECAGPNP